MPLDAVTYIPALDTHALYRERRERAAALWATVPPEQFDMGEWRGSGQCGTTACALGWLAELRVDGWEWFSVGRSMGFLPGCGIASSITASARYFALPHLEAGSLFGDCHSDLTAAGVGAVLLALPYCVP